MGGAIKCVMGQLNARGMQKYFIRLAATLRVGEEVSPGRG